MSLMGVSQPQRFVLEQSRDPRLRIAAAGGTTAPKLLELLWMDQSKRLLARAVFWCCLGCVDLYDTVFVESVDGGKENQQTTA